MRYAIEAPPRILYGRGEAAKAPGLIRAFGPRGIVVHGRDPVRANWLIDALGAVDLLCIPCLREPVLDDLTASLTLARTHRPDWVVALGGGAALDLGKALAALILAPGDPTDHLEVVGRALPLAAPPLPFVALPTTAGTGAEVTKNAVIGLPDHGRKVSLRDPAMLARLAIVDPALTDHCPRAVTLASGLDAITQVIEPFLSCRATAFTDAITGPALALGLPALMRLMQDEDATARDTMAHVSLTGGLALANAGLGAVHGLAGVIGGLTGASHGAICGALLGPVLAENRRALPFGQSHRITTVLAHLGAALGCAPGDAPQALSAWARQAGLPGLADGGLARADLARVAALAQTASSMKANPVPLTDDALIRAMDAAF